MCENNYTTKDLRIEFCHFFSIYNNTDIVNNVIVTWTNDLNNKPSQVSFKCRRIVIFTLNTDFIDTKVF